MDTRDREAIEGLFSKLGTVEREAAPRDAEAEAFIADRLTRQPGAPYYMAQTIVMQEAALANQQQRIEELERENGARQRTGEGGFLSRMLGGSSPRSVPGVGGGRSAGGAWGERNARGAEADGPYGQGATAYGQNAAPYNQQGQGFGRGMGGGMGGGGFLAGAAQTAMGVAGGVLLGNALAGMFTGNEEQAAEPSSATDDTAAENTAAEDNGGQNEPAAENASDDGGWFGGGGDDSGGGFDEI